MRMKQSDVIINNQTMMFKTNASALEDYLRALGFLEPIPTRCDLYFKPRFLSFFSQQDTLKCFKRVVALANQSKTIVVKLKMVICLHQIAMNKDTLHQHILDQTIDELENNGNQNQNSVKWLHEVATFYYNYVRKLCANSEVYCLAKQGRPLSKHETMESMITKVYMIMNLIKSSFKTKEFILNFGRYFKAEFPIIIDVNKNLVHDAGVLYNYFVEIINTMLKDYKTKLVKDQIKQLLTIVDETFLIHQDLYVMFYNRYYAYDIDAPKVNWLKIQSEDYEELKNAVIEKKKKRRVDGSKASIDSVDLSQFENTYFSQTASTNKEFEFESLEI